jgi:hypothetical protein
LLNPLVGTLNIFAKTSVSFAESHLLRVFSGGFVFAENPLDVIFPVTHFLERMAEERLIRRMIIPMGMPRVYQFKLFNVK